MIEAYQGLSSDPVVQLLTQISANTSSYAVAQSFINSTAPATSFLDFEPTALDIRVSYLWTTSLTLTVVTASLGILVKQWLREFKGINESRSASIIARIRIRQFRQPALRNWKVFEIAATLPLLIQVSLGLFLLGLCYHTSSIHPGLDIPSVVIVVAWVVFFVATSLAPAISSDCPYKVTSFLSGFTWIRARLCRVRWLEKFYVGPTTAERSPVGGAVRLWGAALLWAATIGMWWTLGAVAVVSWHTLFPRDEKEKARETNTTPGRPDDEAIPQDPHAVTATNEVANGLRVPLEETQVAEEDSRDLEILAIVDGALLDDELVRSTLKSSGKSLLVNFLSI